MSQQKVILGLRIFLGAVFTIFGLNGFLHFIPLPPPSEAAQNFMGALLATGYFFPFLKLTEILVGLCFLSGFFVPLAALILAPITLNILAMHVFLDPTGLPMSFVLTAAHLALGFLLRDRYAALLKMT